jgi:hypothetical protein
MVFPDTIISWTDPEVATDLALSFQETMGCSFIWLASYAHTVEVNSFFMCSTQSQLEIKISIAGLYFL